MRKMKTYLELERKFGAQPQLQPHTSKKKGQGESDCAAHAHQHNFAFKPNLFHWSHSNSSYHYGDIDPMPVAKPAATEYNLAQGKFKEIPYQVRKSQEEEGPSTPSSNNSLVEQ